MDIRGHDARIHRKRGTPAQLDFLADGGDGIRDAFAHRLFGNGALMVQQLFQVAVFRECVTRDGFGDSLELLVLRYEIRFRIQFDDGGFIAFCGDADKPLGGHAACLFARVSDALRAQPVFRGLEIAFGFGECLLTIHHARAGGFAEVFDYACG